MALVQKKTESFEECLECDRCGITINIDHKLHDLYQARKLNWYLNNDITISLCPSCLDKVVHGWVDTVLRIKVAA